MLFVRTSRVAKRYGGHDADLLPLVRVCDHSIDAAIRIQPEVCHSVLWLELPAGSFYPLQPRLEDGVVCGPCRAQQ